MDRGEIDDVEAELGQPRQLLLDALQATPGAREQLVPRAEAGELAIDLEHHRAERGGANPGLLSFGDRVESLVHQRRLIGGAQRLLDRRPIAGAGRLRGDLPEQDDAFGELAAEVLLARLELPRELVAPGPEAIGPSDDLELPAPGPVRDERASPADAALLSVDRAQLDLVPGLAQHRPVADHGPHEVVAVPKDVGGYLHRVVDAALGRIPTDVHRRFRVLDHDPFRWRGG